MNSVRSSIRGYTFVPVISKGKMVIGKGKGDDMKINTTLVDYKGLERLAWTFHRLNDNITNQRRWGQIKGNLNSHAFVSGVEIISQACHRTSKMYAHLRILPLYVPGNARPLHLKLSLRSAK